MTLKGVRYKGTLNNSTVPGDERTDKGRYSESESPGTPNLVGTVVVPTNLSGNTKPDPWYGDK